MENKEITNFEKKWNQFKTEKKNKEEQELNKICLTAQTRFVTYDEVIQYWDALSFEGKYYGWCGKQMPEVGERELIAKAIVWREEVIMNIVHKVEDTGNGFIVYYTPYVDDKVKELPKKIIKIPFSKLFIKSK
jgi:hypothetical protein